MPKLFLRSSLLTSFVLCFLALPSSAQIPSAACNTVVQQGANLNWMTLGNGLPINRGTMTVNVVRSDGGWSTTMVNQTSENRSIDASGKLNSSSLTLVNAASGETWTGRCNQRGIGGQINSGSGLTFVIW